LTEDEFKQLDLTPIKSGVANNHIENAKCHQTALANRGCLQVDTVDYNLKTWF